jgi:Spy/CpxP family protein refolding chaperone
MKKISGWLVLGVAAAVGIVGLAVGSAAAQQGGSAAEEDDERRPGRGRLALVRAALDLTDDQVQEAREAFRAFREDTRALRQQVRDEARRIPDLVRGGELSEADLMAVHEKVHDVAGQIGEKRVAMLYKMWQRLTPEQREKLADLIAEHADGAGFGFLGGGPGRRGPAADL